MNINKLEKILIDNNQPKFRLSQIKKAIFQAGFFSFLEISNLPKNLREILNKEISILPFKVKKVLVEKNKKSSKALLELADGNLLETVLISPIKNYWTACISTQVGCPLNCQFCATGKNGFKRNLTAEEITSQVLFWRQYLNNSQELKNKNYKLTNIVFMGMGEPFLNWGETRKSLYILNNLEFFGIGWRNISISTCGVPEGIKKMSIEFPQVNLAISLHFANNEKRSKYMPINNKYELRDLKKALEDYFLYSKRKVFLEYIMLSGINDTAYDAKDLINFIKSIKQNYLLHVNLIQYNEISNKFKPSAKSKIENFKKYLEDNHVSVTIRKSLGKEIKGACGQLSAK